MHAAANALPMPATGPSLGAKWIKANLLVAILVPLTTALLPFMLNRIPGMPLTSLTAMSWLNAALGFFAVAANMTIYAILTASVLGEKLPAFSRRAWIATHLALAAVLGLLLALINFQPGAGSRSGGESEWTELLAASGGTSDWIALLIGALVVMLTFGAVIGGLQALVLRRAARGMLAWIAGSVIGGCAAAAVPIAFDLARSGLARPGSNVVVMSILSESGPFLWVMTMAIMMLPAFNRLAPKN
jgi:hypothetical protein